MIFFAFVFFYVPHGILHFLIVTAESEQSLKPSYSYMNIIHFIRELMFPGGCGICGSMLITGKEAYLGLCTRCEQKLEYSLDERCGTCGRPLISEIGICMHCRKTGDNQERFLDSMMALYPYTGIYRQLLASYKFEQYKQLSFFLASKLIDAGRGIESKYGSRLTWIPVPPRPGKIKNTGWDQIDYLAGKIERGNQIPVSRCLKRLNSMAQKLLNRSERLANLKGQIICSGKAPRDVLIFDDVVTTGATLEACAESLKKAGAEHVYGVCLFYD